MASTAVGFILIDPSRKPAPQSWSSCISGFLGRFLAEWMWNYPRASRRGASGEKGWVGQEEERAQNPQSTFIEYSVHAGHFKLDMSFLTAIW